MQDSGPLEITAAGPGITLSGEITMKRTLISLAGLLVAGSLIAATEKPAAPQTTTAPPDSPLVAAAKKSNRIGKKRIVITDETVKTSTGHLSTTKYQNDFHIQEPEKTAEVILAETKAKERERAPEREKLKKEAAEAKQKQIARAVAAAEEEGPYQEDPAAVEHQLDQQTSTAGTSSSQPRPSKHDDSERP
jgi:hypothetical protein